MTRLVGLALVLMAGLTACGKPPPHTTGLYLLIDTSGTYNKEVSRVQNIILASLQKMHPGDSIALARIDTASFTEKNIITKKTFDEEETRTNQQKIEFKQAVQKFIQDAKPAPYTDITGGILQAIEFLNEKNTARKEILIFSDMEEDLAKGYVRDVPLNLKGFEVVALNVTKLRSDNFDPRQYMTRLDAWKARVEKGGGSWRVINDLDYLGGVL
jgi:hypothetical protein